MRRAAIAAPAILEKARTIMVRAVSSPPIGAGA